MNNSRQVNNPAAEQAIVCGICQMFVSLPHYEFPFPEGLAEPGSKHWRVMELSLHAPWFLLTVELKDPADSEMLLSYTLCLAWNADLVDALRNLDGSRVLGVVAMMPAWASANGQWSSREVTEVWLCQSETGQHVVLKDVAGEEFSAGFGDIPDSRTHSELLLRLGPRRPPGQTHLTTGTRSPRRRAAKAQ